jgi:PBP1b-binding outer membrane lipoprotein LpoB
MKKASIVLAICLLIALVLGSCSGSKKCPAYSQNIQIEKAEVIVC